MHFDGLPFTDITPGVSRFFEQTRSEKKRQRNKPGDYPVITLTDGTIAAAIPPRRETWIHDAECSNLAIRCRPCGSVSFYIWDYGAYDLATNSEGPLVRMPLGSVKDYTVAEARIWATKMAERGKYWRYELRKLTTAKNLPLRDLIPSYLDDRHSGDFARPSKEATLTAIESLLTKHITPRFGDMPVWKVKRKQWLLLIEKVRLVRPSRGVHLHKAVKAFLNWCVAQGILEGNPIAGTVTDNPFKMERPNLSLKDLCAIYHACVEIGHPASEMFRLIILTGEQLKWIRIIRDEAIDWENRFWAVEYRMDYKTAVPIRQIALSAPAFRILRDRRTQSSFLFPSQRGRNVPINISTEFMHELREKSGVKGAWGAREVHAAARCLLDHPGKPGGDLEIWALGFINTYEETHNIGDQWVEL